MHQTAMYQETQPYLHEAHRLVVPRSIQCYLGECLQPTVLCWAHCSNTPELFGASSDVIKHQVEQFVDKERLDQLFVGLS